MEIPIDKVDFGIKRSLQSSRRINKAAKALLEDYTPMGQVEVREHNSAYSIVLFYYAVEELGKAIRLETLKRNSIENGCLTIEDDQLFSNHDYKINIANKRYPKLIIPNWEKKFIKENTYQLIPVGKIIKNFTDRSNLWLVSFDEKKGSWRDWLNDVDDEEITKSINELDKVLNKWMKKYGRLSKKPRGFDDGS